MGREDKGALAGQHFGSYELVRLLGSGGMAEVYLARDRALDREVAVKVLLDELKDEKEFVRRFRDEERRVARLDHPHIIPIYTAGEHNGRLYMVMPVVPQSLRRRLEQQPPLTAEEAIRITQQLASALDAAHQVGLIHRDLKPENVLLDANGDALLTDFGIARTLSPDARDRRPSLVTLSNSGLPVGTPEYMSPEQLKGEPLDQRTDIYALGAILYEMLTGHLARSGETPYQVAAQTLNTPLTPPSEYNADLSLEVETVVMRAMAVDREDRYATSRQFAAALEEARVGRATRGRATSELNIPPLPTGVKRTIGTVGTRRGARLRGSSTLASHKVTRGAPASWERAASAGELGAGRWVRLPAWQGMMVRVNWRRWWWAVALAFLLTGIGGVGVTGMLAQSAGRATSTASTSARATAQVQATQASVARAAYATATSMTAATATAQQAIAAHATATAQAVLAAPTATQPPPTATPTPRLTLGSTPLLLAPSPQTYATTCASQELISNPSNANASWDWNNPPSSVTSQSGQWTITYAVNGSQPHGNKSPSDKMSPGQQDRVSVTATLTSGTATTCDQLPTFTIQMTDGYGHRYSIGVQGTAGGNHGNTNGG